MKLKEDLRKELRAARRQHVASLPQATRSLLFLHPPTPLSELVQEGASIGVYHATPHEAPARSYAKFYFERGHAIAMPRFTSRNAPMRFAEHTDPYEDSDCEVGPYGLAQPRSDAEDIAPDLLFVPLLGFTRDGERLGQGGGHYDRWLAAHPETLAVGLAWDCQLLDNLPSEAHDKHLDAVVTPTRLYGPF